MKVQDLTGAQFEELKREYAYTVNPDLPTWESPDTSSITDEEVITFYEGVEFTNKDFWCTCCDDDE